MVKQVASRETFEEFAGSLFRLTRTLRSTAHLWGQMPGKLTRTDVTILRILAERGDTRPGCIAEQLGVGPSVVSRQLGPLTGDGLVVRRPDPQDGRAELISLTDNGHSRLRAVRENFVQGMREQFTDWDDAKVLEAAALLEEISDHLAPVLGRREPPDATTTHQEEPHG